jgi:hypothetical protein
MRKLLTAFITIVSFPALAQEQDLGFLHISKFYSDSIYYTSNNSTAFSSSFIKNEFANFNLATVLRDKQQVKKVLGYTKKNRGIDLYYFPGTSNKKALVIGGVHGSELSAIEVAKSLIQQLSSGEKPYYSVIIIPSLFPDNTAMAEECKRDRILRNAGRYTNEGATDPNRQMPALGRSFNSEVPVDANSRQIEKENALLLQLIQAYGPQRIISLHAIKDKKEAGVFADPRTDCEGRALGFSSDSTLALLMAGYIEKNGGIAAGNRVKKSPTALYYFDPKNAVAGQSQERNLKGSNHSPQAHGVSLGGWAATAICDEANNYYRQAIRILTIEFPGYKKQVEYTTSGEQKWYAKQVNVYASSIYTYFIQQVCEEESLPNDVNSLAGK